jgi:DNA polymerase III epsilon subunit-like protein
MFKIIFNSNRCMGVISISDQEKMNTKWRNTLDYYVQPKKISVIDIETTGLDIGNDLILEIGICELNVSNGSIKKIFDKVVREPKFSDKHRIVWIFQNSNLKYEDVLSAPMLDTFYQELQIIFDSYPITAYNKKFDLGFLKRRGFTFKKELECPMIVSTNILKIPFPSRPDRYVKNDTISPRPENQYKFPNVEEAWKYYFPNDDYKEIHRAYNDAEHEARIVYEMYLRNYLKIEFD